jgi:arabinosyltransferase C
LLVGLVGIIAALALPFAPVWAEQTTVSWPAPGMPTASSTALFAPYRPTALHAVLPCQVLRAAAGRTAATTVLSTAARGDGLLVRVADGSVQVLLGGRLVDTAAVTGPDCGVRVDAATGGTNVMAGDRSVQLDAEPPVVQLLRTDLDPGQAAGLSVTAQTSSVFDLRATGTKTLLIAVWAAAALLALGWLWLRGRSPSAGGGLEGAGAGDDDRPGARRDEGAGAGGAAVGARARVGSWLLDLGVLLVLAGWALVGPLSDDDGFAAMIARNSHAAGYQGNYYRWWNASETPFALAQHVLAPLTSVSVSPLWLRLPSTLLAVLTWLLLSHSVLPAALPAQYRSGRTRLLAAVCFLACWLPFNLGVRPEAYVAFGVTAVLALLWRGRSMWALGGVVLVAGVTLTASPAAVVLAAPVLAFSRKIARIVTGNAGRWVVVARLSVLCCLAGVALAVVFADQSWHALVVATLWHNDFGPSLPWYDEFARYEYLLNPDQDGTATKRVPVLLTLVLLPVVGLVLARRVEGNTAARGELVGPGAARLTAVALLGLATLWLTPSKWSHYFGALAGVLAAFLVVAVVLLVRCARPAGRTEPAPATDRLPGLVGLGGATAVSVAAALAFSGPNAWWQPAVYDVPWADGPITPAGVPLNSPLLWLALLAAGYLLVRRRAPGRARTALVAGPGLLATLVAAMSVLVLLFSFAAAPLRQPSGSLALSNAHRLLGRSSCGLGDDVQVLPDVPGSVLRPAGGDPGQASGFAFGAGYDPAAPPPEPPGVGASAQLWGSLVGSALDTGSVRTPWFGLPAVAPDREVTVSVAGRTDGGNSLSLQFGRAEPDGQVTALGTRVPPDPLRSEPGESPQYQLWRAVGVPAGDIPSGADRVRVRAVDATSAPDGWLAVTGPRLRQVLGLRQFLASHSPVLVAWPIAFLFPCAVDIPAVRDGLAGAPVSVLEAPLRYSGLSAATTDQTIGGTFATLRDSGRLGEVTTRLAGRSGTDWGNLLLTGYPAARDTYRATVSWREVSGLRGDGPALMPPTRPSTP